MSKDALLSRHMTREEPMHENKFVPVMLPWIVAAAAFLVYLLTLNHWIGVTSIEKVAHLTGLMWQPELTGPLYWLVTYPVRWLPAGLVPVALNALSAVFAALTLALLARSVALLPHDRTQQQRLRERSPFSLLTVRTAWLAPVAAVLLCGLQLTMWENATVASQEMFDLLIFAYLIRCLLEFRIDGRQSWLFRASFLYAAGMTEHWALVGFFPFFLAALMWIKGLSFFNMRFLVGMFLCGLAGLSFYLLLPLVNAVGPYGEEFGFWQFFKIAPAEQKKFLSYVWSMLFRGDRPFWVLGLASLLPLLVMGIRWPSFSGDLSRLGQNASEFMFHLFHGGLLLYCAWTLLDPPVSPRNFGINLPMLYYLAALAIGYFIGYFLLVLRVKPGRTRPVPDPEWVRLAKAAALAGVWIVAIATPALLIYRNLPQVAATNGALVSDFSSLMHRGLPPQGGIVLSDDPWRMLVAQSEAIRRGEAGKFIFLNTGGNPSSLQRPQFHRYLKQRHGAAWPVELPSPARAFEPAELIRMLYDASQTNQVAYLHPSFGYYFEVFYPSPHGLVQWLHRYPTNSLLAPEPTQETIKANLDFWAGAGERELATLRNAMAPSRGKPALLESVLARLKVPRKPNPTASFLSGFYSRSLTFWGVELQKAGLLKEAESCFRSALDVNRDNPVARVNLEVNGHLQAGRHPMPPPSQPLQKQLGEVRSWDEVVGQYGPFDHPAFAYEQGLTFLRHGNRRQAAQQFARSANLETNNLVAQLALAGVYVFTALPDKALEVMKEVRATTANVQLASTNEVPLMKVEASAYLAKGDAVSAQQAVQRALAAYPDDTNILAGASQIFADFGYYSNSLEYVERGLRRAPGSTGLLFDQAFIYLQLGVLQQDQSQTNLADATLERASSLLTRVLEREREKKSELYSKALLNRAIALQRRGKFLEAKNDYSELLKSYPNAPQLHYGLGEVAEKLNDREEAIRHYQLYLQIVPTNAPDPFNVMERLKALGGASPREAAKDPR